MEKSTDSSGDTSSKAASLLLCFYFSTTSHPIFLFKD